jgi:hypothetical protein
VKLLLSFNWSKDIELIDFEKSGLFCGQNRFGRGKPIKNIGNVNKGSRGALIIQDIIIVMRIKGKQIVKFKIMNAREDLRRCFFKLKFVIVSKIKPNIFCLN